MLIAFVLIGPQPHMTHAQDGQGGFATQRQVTLRSSADLMRPSLKMAALLL